MPVTTRNQAKSLSPKTPPRVKSAARNRKTTQQETQVTNGHHEPHINGHESKSQEPESRAAKGWRWLEKTWDLVHHTHLPHFLQDNEYLHNHHRPQLPSFRQCLHSAFTMHTETCNIWTHALGCLGTLIAAIYFWLSPNVEITQKIWFSFFFVGAITCMGFSAAYHTLLCHSEKVYKNLAKMDYCGIVVLIVSSFPPWMNYCFYCNWGIKTIYLVSVSLLGGLCIYVVVNERFSAKEYRPYRAGLFIALGLTGVIPAIHYLIAHGLNEALKHLPWLLFMAFLYIFGGLIYALRIPERLGPGKFDIWGHSHQFLHICVVGGVISCYCGMRKIANDKIGIDCGNFTTWETS